jgi:hypothetical protein
LIPDPDPTNIGSVGNTSTFFGISVIIGKRWGQLKWTNHTNKGDAPSIAWLETVAILVGILMLLQLGVTCGKLFTVYTDNNITLNAILKWSSKDHQVNKEWAVMQDILLAEHIDIHPVRITSVENRADGLSQHLWGTHAYKLCLPLSLPPNLLLLFTQM